jgi:hypothetical protein
VRDQRLRHCLRIRREQVEQPPHLRHRQVEAAEPADQPRDIYLVGAIAPVAAARVNERRSQQADGVVVPQRLGSQPARTCELADAQQAL